MDGVVPTWKLGSSPLLLFCAMRLSSILCARFMCCRRGGGYAHPLLTLPARGVALSAGRRGFFSFMRSCSATNGRGISHAPRTYRTAADGHRSRAVNGGNHWRSLLTLSAAAFSLCSWLCSCGTFSFPALLPAFLSAARANSWEVPIDQNNAGWVLAADAGRLAPSACLSCFCGT